MAAIGSQGRVRGENPGGQVSQRAACDVREDLFRHRVVAVLPLGLDQLGSINSLSLAGSVFRLSSRTNTARSACILPCLLAR